MREGSLGVHRVGLAAAGTYGVVLVAMVLAGLAQTSGHFFYALDDAYIHLELARHLASGHHGLNAGETTSPASSVLWPWLLVPGWWLGGARWLPLVWNIASALATFAALGVAAERVLGRLSWPVALAWGALGVAIAHQPMLTLVGMEHSLQVALTAWFAVGVMQVDGGRAPPWWALAIGVVLPAFRYECMGLVLLAAAWWGWRGHRRDALVLSVGAVLPVLAYGAWLWVAVGYPLPLSVLSRSSLFTPAWAEPWQPVVFVPVGVAAVVAWRRPGPVSAMALMVLLGHVLLAQVGILHRYITYAVVYAALLGAWAMRDALAAGVATGGGGLRVPLYVAALLAAPGIRLPVDAVASQVFVWRQHAQLRALIDRLGPVAVNDVGLVGLDRDAYLLDLTGLASKAAYEGHRDRADVEWMDELVVRHDVRAVVIYPSWLPRRPAAWVPVGSLWVDSMVYPTNREVLILAPRDAQVPAILDAMDAVEPRLPAGSWFERVSGTDPG